MNKRGFELTISTLILMILGAVLLAVLIIFFTMGSTAFMDTISGFFSYSNVDPVVSSCNVFAASEKVYNYCCEKNKVKYYVNGTKSSEFFSCNELLNQSFVTNLKEMNCREISC